MTLNEAAAIRNTKANRRWFGGAMPVKVEPHQFWPMTEAERVAAGKPRLSLVCRDCGSDGLYGRDGKYRHRKVNR